MIQVYSTSGTLVAESTGDYMPTENLTAGIYIVKARLDDGRSATAKIIVR